MPATALQDERFLVLDALGRGGMASVYRAYDRLDRRLVALKVQHRPEAPGPAHPMSAEFDAWARQRHSNVVRAYELALARSGPFAPGTPYLVLEHVEGRALLEVLRPGDTAPHVIESVAAQLLDGLAHVHASGYVHRDLKPGNVLASTGGSAATRIMLTDFGLAVPTGRMPEVGRISGSLPYLPPETVLGMPLDGRADLYSLGILLYQLATGALPARPASARGWIRWHLERPPLDPRAARRDLPPALARLIRRLSARRRDERPDGAVAALDELGRSATEPRAAVAGHRALRAQLRLALDAARQGAIRVFELPACEALAEALRREALIWTQIHGLARLALDRPETDGCPLARPLLGLLLERGAEAPQLVERFRLHEWLPLEMLGAVPVLDGRRERPVSGPGTTALTEFVLDCAARRPLVVEIGTATAAHPAVAGMRRRLATFAQREDRPRPGCGGLVLLVPRPGPSSSRAAAPRKNPGRRYSPLPARV